MTTVPHFLEKNSKRTNGVYHQKFTPLWPQANAEAENFMRPLTKAVRSLHAEGRDWKKDLYLSTGFF